MALSMSASPTFPNLEALYLPPDSAKFPGSPKGAGGPVRMEFLSPWQLSSAE